MAKNKKNSSEKVEIHKLDKTQKFEEILKLGQISASSLGKRAFQKEVSKSAKKILQCERIHLYIYDKKSNQLVRDYWGKDAKQVTQVCYDIDQSTFIGTCAYEHNILNLIDIQNDLRSKRMDESMKEIDCHSLLLAPMYLQGEIVGVIKGINSVDKQFSSEDEFFIQAIANQISIVINNFKLVESLHKQFIQVVQALADAIGKKDTYTGGHTKRVGHFAEMIAKEMDLPHNEMVDLKLAAVLHDVGKIGIEDKILKKKAPLTDEEFKIMREHPRLGYEILGHIESLSTVVDGMRFHHERPDGKGYPYGLKGDEIPIIASIISVADTFDAMISTRPYRKGLPPMVAYDEIMKYSGTQFDSRVVEAFVKGFKKTKMYKEDAFGEKKKAS